MAQTQPTLYEDFFCPRLFSTEKYKKSPRASGLRGFPFAIEVIVVSPHSSLEELEFSCTVYNSYFERISNKNPRVLCVSQQQAREYIRVTEEENAMMWRESLMFAGKCAEKQLAATSRFFNSKKFQENLRKVRKFYSGLVS